VDEYSQTVKELFDSNDQLSILMKSMELSLHKYNKTKDPASASSVAASRDIPSSVIHPLLQSRLVGNEEVLMKF